MNLDAVLVDWQAQIGIIERSLLSAWLNGPSFRSRWTPKQSDFHDARTRAIAGACAAMAARGIKASSLPSAELMGELARSGDLTRLWSVAQPMALDMPSRDPDADLERWSALRIRFALRQRLAELVSTMTPSGDLPRDRKALLEALREASVSGAVTAISLADGFADAYTDMTRRSSVGYKSGLKDIDDATGGLRPGHVWVIGAPTNWGKSSLAIAIADHHLRTHSSGVLLVTCEDDSRLLFTRWLVRRAGINGKRARDARLTADETDAAASQVHAAGTRKKPVMIDGRGRSVEALVEDIKGMVGAHGIRLVLVDYLQCMKAEFKAQDRRAEINYIGRMLTDAIKTSGAAGVLTSQLTGDDIRESRDIEHAAEVVLIGRQADDGSKSLFLKKNKTGPSGFETALPWDAEAGTFVTEEVPVYDEIDYDTM